MKNWKMLVMGCLMSGSVWAQVPDVGEYTATFSVIIRDGVNNHDGGCTNKFELFTTISGGQEQRVWNVDLNPIGTSWKSAGSDSITIPVDKKLVNYRFRGERNWKNWLGCNGNDGWSSTTLSYGTCYSQSSVSGKIPEWDSRVSITVFPNRMNFFYFNRAGIRETKTSLFYLPQSHKIQVQATSGYPIATYKWQFQIPGVKGWTDIPSHLYSGNILNLSGNDLPGVNFLNDVVLAGNNVQIRMNVGCNKYLGIMTLRPLMSSPDIISVEGIAPSCSYFSDGKLKVTFSRALYSGETISFVMAEGLGTKDLNVTAFDADNSYTITGLNSFSNRNLSFSGDYFGPTYTDDPTTHNKLVSVPIRPPVVFAATPAAVHCFGGEDGQIAVTASGGTDVFTSYLVHGNDTLQQINLTTSSGASFMNLKTGTYSVRIRDSNQCDAVEAGQVKVISQTVNTPVRGVIVTAVENVEPLGYGLTNGYVVVRGEQGTGPYTFTWTDSAGQVLAGDAPVDEGGSMKQTLPNIGKGTYHVVVRDARYNQATPQHEKNVRGCYDTLTMVVDQPALLEVLVKDTHYVTCYADEDGELVAQARGGRPYAAGLMYSPYRYEWFRVHDDGNVTAFGISDSTVVERPAGVYRVRVTDRNGITATSEDFTLVQPDPLLLTFNTATLKCNGDRDGYAEVTPNGGTWPYRYAWSTEESTSRIENLTDGKYSVVVQDVRGCTALGNTAVTVPHGLEVVATQTDPVCRDAADGSIVLQITGGVPGYQSTWDDGQLGDSRTGLAHGSYKVRITDANGCFLDRLYTLDNPELFPVDLGPDRVLCMGQALALNPAIDDPAAQYQWQKDGTVYANTASVSLSDAGTYSLRITDGNNCQNGDEITIARDNAEIAAKLAVATRVPQHGKVRVANISYPTPEKIEWIIPSGARVLEQTQEYLDVSFSSLGKHTVGIKGVKGACEKVFYSDVQVVRAAELTDYQTPDEPYIRQFSVAPNPNDGKFTVIVELKEAATFRLVLYANQSNIIRQDEFSGKSFVTADYDLRGTVGSGLYILQLITAQGQSIYKIMIN